MLKFKDSEGKVVGRLKDEDSEPTFYADKSEKKIKDESPKTEPTNEIKE